MNELLNYIVPAFRNEPKIYNELFYIVQNFELFSFDFLNLNIYPKNAVIGCTFRIEYRLTAKVDDTNKPILKDVTDEITGKIYKNQLIGYKKKKYTTKIKETQIEVRVVPNNEDGEVNIDGTFKPTLIWLSVLENKATYEYLNSQKNESNIN